MAASANNGNRVGSSLTARPHGSALGVALVGLDPVTRRARNLARGHDAHIDPALTAGPGQTEPRRPGLIDRADRAGQRREELHDLARRHSQLHTAKLTAGHVEDRGMRLRRMHIKPDERHTPRHGRHLPELGCRRQDHPAAQSPHISARGADRSTPQAGPDRPPSGLDRMACRLERQACPGVVYGSAPAHEMRGFGAQVALRG